MLIDAVILLARLWPRAVDPSEDLARALRTLDVPIDADTVVRAGYGGGIAVGVAGVPVVLIVPAPPLVLGLAGTALALAHSIHVAPILLAQSRRSRAAGRAAALIGRATLRMRIAPAPEAAAVFAAHGAGPLAESLKRHVRRARAGPTTGLESFASEWEPWSPWLARALRTVESAGSLPPADRERALERARRTVLEGRRDRAAEDAAALRAPVTALYALGVFLPLALVGILPAAAAAGAAVPAWLLALGFDGLLPVGLAGASVHLLARRPAAFPPAAVTRAHPDVPDRRWPVAAGALLAGGVAGGLAWTVLPGWTCLPAGLGIGAGVLLVGLYRPMKAVRATVRSVETDLPDTLALVGRKVAEGTAVERAIEQSASELGSPAAEAFGEAARIQQTLGIAVEPALLGPHGALAQIPSVQARDAARLLALAAREGRPAGEAIVAMADHLEDLRALERESRRTLRRITATLSHTAAMFGPLVAGATVALFDGVAGGRVGASLATGAVGAVLGLYVLALAAILAVLATGLERGLDRALVGHRVGRTLLSATVTYLAAFWVGGLLT